MMLTYPVSTGRGCWLCLDVFFALAGPVEARRRLPYRGISQHHDRALFSVSLRSRTSPQHGALCSRTLCISATMCRSLGQQ